MRNEISFVEGAQIRFADRRRKVWLECNGEPYDYRALNGRTIRSVGRDLEIVSFVCPRCGRQHESLVFH
jgi:hypothetical protein